MLRVKIAKMFKETSLFSKNKKYEKIVYITYITYKNLNNNN